MPMYRVEYNIGDCDGNDEWTHDLVLANSPEEAVLKVRYASKDVGSEYVCVGIES